MELSINLTEEDVALLDDYLRRSGLDSRSAVIRRALHLLKQRELRDDYAAAWDAWAESGEQAAWESTIADGLSAAPR